MYPNKLEQLINILEKLPGVGNKTAQRYAFNIMDNDEEQIDAFIDADNEINSIALQFYRAIQEKVHAFSVKIIQETEIQLWL